MIRDASVRHSLEWVTLDHCTVHHWAAIIVGCHIIDFDLNTLVQVRFNGTNVEKSHLSILKSIISPLLAVDCEQ